MPSEATDASEAAEALAADRPDGPPYPRPSGEPAARCSSTDLPTLLEALWHSAESAAMICDDTLQIIHANPAAMISLPARGLRVGAAADRSGSFVLRDDGGPPLSAESLPVRRALRGEAVIAEELVIRVVGESLARRQVVSAYPLPRPTGPPWAFVTWRDVTNGWEAELERRTSVEQLGKLIEGAADYAILMLDVRGHMMTWSSSAQRLLGYRESEALGMPFEVLYTAEDQTAGLPARILERARTAGKAETDGRRVRSDGTTFWARGVVTAQYDPDGELIGFVKVTHDVTAEREAQARVIELNEELRRFNDELEERIALRTLELQAQAEELAFANEELHAFSYSVSHDLRAPLRAMSGFARMLGDAESHALGVEGRRYVARIRASATQMGELIDGLLGLSRLHRQPLADVALDMTELARQAWTMVVPADASVTLDLGELPPSHGDRRLVAQIWLNLLENAVKFSRDVPDATIEVSGTVCGGVPVYRVADHGVGFDMDHADKLFEPFHRLHSVEEYPGNGIGLALVQRIVRRHGGTVEVAAEPHRGATFTFTLGDGR